MTYRNLTAARFLARPNRFIAQVEVNGKIETVHVKNTGRCRELLVPDATVYLAEGDNPARKTRYDLVMVEKKREGKPPLLVNMDSQAANALAEEWLRRGERFGKDAVIRREVTYGKSRFDFYIEDGDRRAFLEVKGVTLERDGVAAFPDAPTERGVKHIEELIACQKEGYSAYLLFVVQMKGISCVRPNDETHPAFGEALRRAEAAGVTLLAVDCRVSLDGVTPDSLLPVVTL
jgi:sugar fermentation stimulation protein A